MGTHRLPGALVCALMLSVGVAGTAQAQPAPPTFSPLTGEGSCVVATGGDATCAAAPGVSGASEVAVSPDQRNVYVAAAGADAVVTFTRDESGRLKHAGCISDDGGDGRFGSDGLCTDGDGLRTAARVTVSPDGRRVYVVSPGSNSLSWFARDAETGALQQAGCYAWHPIGPRCPAIFGLWGPSDFALSADGSRLYVTSHQQGSVTQYALDAEQGTLGWAGCVSYSGSDGTCEDGAATEGLGTVAVAPGSGTVYAAGGLAQSLVWFGHAESGALTQLGCLRPAAIEGARCGAGPDLGTITDLVFSPNGADAYGVASGTITRYRRGADDALAPADCVRHADPAGDDAVRSDEDGEDEEDEDEEDEDAELLAADCAPAKALRGASRLSLTPDGRTLVASGAGSMAVFARAEDGTLRQLACAEQFATYRSCLPILNGIGSPAISPDGKSMYVTSTDGVRVFTLAAAPAGTSAHVSGARAAVRVGCPARKRRACKVRVRLGAKRSHHARKPVRIARGRYRTITTRIPPKARRALAQRGRTSAVVRVRDVSTRTRVAIGRVRLRTASR